MKSFNNLTIVALTAVFIFSGCSNSSNQETQSTETAEAVPEVPEITISKLTGSPAYADAALLLSAPETDRIDTGAVTFSFDVQNYELGVQTEGAGSNGLANSGNGQHIHFIVDNDPYSAHYEPSFEKSFTPGSHVVLAFLSRSYHESVKNPHAFVLKQFMVGDGEEDALDFTAQHMFYSRPKGTYSGADAQKLMLDFYLVNTTLSPDGNKVRANVNGTEFLIDEWAPYVIEGLPMGEVSINLELIDSDGNLIPGPFNSVERSVLLEE